MGVYFSLFFVNMQKLSLSLILIQLGSTTLFYFLPQAPCYLQKTERTLDSSILIK